MLIKSKDYTDLGVPDLKDTSAEIQLSEFEQWQIENLEKQRVHDPKEAESSRSSIIFNRIDSIAEEWIESLTKEQLKKIVKKRSLYGIPTPKKWVEVWRAILREPSLRDSYSAAREGNGLGQTQYLWNIWAEETIDKFLNPMEKFLISLRDQGFPYDEIGKIMIERYGEKFWKPRENTKTLLRQEVIHYFYWRLPVKIARAELTEMVLQRAKR